MFTHRVLIVGGGFGGVKAALELRKHKEIAITLLTENKEFRYYPTFYHTATGGLKAQSAIPLGEILDERVKVVQGKAESVDFAGKFVTYSYGGAKGEVLGYDSVIFALGTVTNYFGIKGLEEYSYNIKTLEGIERFKQHLHDQLAADHKPDLHYVIVGAGPTGIELAGALPEYLRRTMERHGIKRRAIHIELVEAAPRLLPRSNPAVSRTVRRRLRKLGIHLLVKQAVQGQDADGLTINGKELESQTVVWTAGMANNPFFNANNFTPGTRGKVKVDEFLRAAPSVYVIGDNADTMYSGLAQTALYDAHFVAHNIMQELRQRPKLAYDPKRPVSVIPVGDKWAAVEWGKWHISGKIGYLLRSAADWIGFKDLQPWWKASEQWLTEFGSQESCVTCAIAVQHGPADILQRYSTGE